MSLHIMTAWSKFDKDYWELGWRYEPPLLVYKTGQGKLEYLEL